MNELSRTNPLLNWTEFERVEIRVGTVLKCEVFKEARKPAYTLLLDFGPIGQRRSSAQITRLYQPEDVLGKQVLAVVNFPPKQIGPFISECLVLGAIGDGDEVTLIHPGKPVPNGTRIG